MVLRSTLRMLDAVARAAEETAAVLGRIDVLVASAGIAGPTKPLWECTPAEWRRVIDVNLNGLFYCNRAVVPHMLRNDYGRIVNIASIAGKEGNPNASPYSASKAAVIGLTKSLGKELAKTGHPGELRHAGGGDAPRSSTRSRRSTSTSCCRRFRWAASARWRRSRP